MKLVLTCEHAGNNIPKNYEKYFKNKSVLETHRAYDLGALDLFNYLKPLSNSSFYSTTSRLLVELNRSIHHNNLFSEFTKELSKIEKDQILKTHYTPYRSKVENSIRDYIERGNTVLHLSIHSFTPQLNGNLRNCDFGLLYDSSRKPERQYCKDLKSRLLRYNPSLNVRFNYPYLGKADGFTTYLRKQFPTQYLGIEIEVNQKFSFNNLMSKETKESISKAIVP
ncbi:putative N-formylglutamate amidohydrolase [Winogradskyella epiphytica]|uniref:Putative N-formylglutamate amidohydrolase n=1 Tax=Winogradskyella epiphytica TaxID=262005 RepID=A0A2V4WUM8_9FLAO|nr:N-formylglutamate amidohydrolase [Winogradskyella epiphytica]PYE80440.1 putative N-formylglutamate amidohydrolase [Winogradskyella epiphytica]GGW69451.1 hypothetical protein GCM10008085_21760 [Winogradskyella epiphytica]